MDGLLLFILFGNIQENLIDNILNGFDEIVKLVGSWEIQLGQ